MDCWILKFLRTRKSTRLIYMCPSPFAYIDDDIWFAFFVNVFYGCPRSNFWKITTTILPEDQYHLQILTHFFRLVFYVSRNAEILTHVISVEKNVNGLKNRKGRDRVSHIARPWAWKSIYYCTSILRKKMTTISSLVM